jgi:inorganic pyrophosphatase
MTIPLDQLSVWEPNSGRLQFVIEVLTGSRNKYKLDPRCGQLRLDKLLPLGVMFPLDFGFIPSTRGQDGDPLDALVVMDTPAVPGCVVTAQLLGVIEAEQTESGKTIRNDRFVAVLDTPRNPATMRSLEDLGRQRLDEIEHFFIAYNEAEGRRFKPIARGGPEKAKELIAAACSTARHQNP